MRRIYKYPLITTDVQTIKVPGLVGASGFKEQVLKIDSQRNIPCLWCLVDDEEPEQEITLVIVGTGNPMPFMSKDDYLGSYMVFEGEFVGHIFVAN